MRNLTVSARLALVILIALACRGSAPARNVAIPPARLDPKAPASPPALGPAAGAIGPNAPAVTAATPTDLDEENPWSTAHVPAGALDDEGQPAELGKIRKKGGAYEISAGQGSGSFQWVVRPESGAVLSQIAIEEDGAIVRPMWSNLFEVGPKAEVVEARRAGDSLEVLFADGVSVVMTPIGRSLRIDLARQTGAERGPLEFDLGGLTTEGKARAVELVRVAYFDLGVVAAVTLPRDEVRYVTAWLDPGLTHATQLLSQAPTKPATTSRTGGASGDPRGGAGGGRTTNPPTPLWRYSQYARYEAGTEGFRRPVRERIWLTWGERIEDALPSMQRERSPVRDLADDLFYVSFNAYPFEQAAAALRRVGGMGVRDLQLFMHQWQKDGYDTGYPDQVWPPRRLWGGLDGLRGLRDTAAEYGWGFSLHHNWLFNTRGMPNASQLASDGKPSTTKVGDEFLKLGVALDLLDEVEGQFHEAIDTRGSFTDSLTAGLPRIDLDTSEPDWGDMGAALAKEAELFAGLRRIHGGPVAGEGGFGFANTVYAGLIDVMPGTLFLNTRPATTDYSGSRVPVVPHHALGPGHDLYVRAGIGPPTRFLVPKRYSLPLQYVEQQGDQLRTLGMVYGNAGFHWWHFETIPGDLALAWWTQHEVTRRLAAADRPAPEVTYFDEKDKRYDLSEWLADGRPAPAMEATRLRLEWPDGDELWANLTPTPWKPRGEPRELAPMGHLARVGGVVSAVLYDDGDAWFTSSADDQRFLDARGTAREEDGLATDGAVGLHREEGGWRVFPLDDYTLEIPVPGRPQHVSTSFVEVSRAALELPARGELEVDLVWLDERGVAAAGERVALGPTLRLESGAFLERGAMSVRVTPVTTGE